MSCCMNSCVLQVAMAMVTMEEVVVGDGTREVMEAAAGMVVRVAGREDMVQVGAGTMAMLVATVLTLHCSSSACF